MAGGKLEVKKAVKDKDRPNPNRRDGGGRGFSAVGGYSGNMSGGNMAAMGGMGGMNMMNNMNMMGGGGGMGMNNMGFGGGSAMASSGGSGGNGRKRGIDRDFPAMKKPKMEIRDPESEIMRSIFVGNLNPLTEQDELEDYFAKFGKVLHTNLKKQPNSNKNRGFGFIIFSLSSEVDNVMAARPHKLKERMFLLTEYRNYI